MTEKEISELYARLALHSIPCWGHLFQRTWFSRIFYPGSEKIFATLSTRKREKT